MTERERQDLLDLVLEAGYTEGAHHKQYYLTLLLQALMGDVEYDRWRESGAEGSDWDEGIAP